MFAYHSIRGPNYNQVGVAKLYVEYNDNSYVVTITHYVHIRLRRRPNAGFKLSNKGCCPWSLNNGLCCRF